MVMNGRIMDRSERWTRGIQGAGKEVKGAVKQAIGKATGNKQTELEGAAEKAVGKVQGGIGKAKDAVRDAFRK